MLRRASSIVVPSFCLVLSACAQDDGQSGPDELATDSSGDEAQQNCPPAGPFGTEIGEVIDNLVFYDKDGGQIALHDSFCEAEHPALVIFGTAAW